MAKSCIYMYMYYIFGDLGRSWTFLKELGGGGRKQNTFREQRKIISGIWRYQCVIFSYQGSTDPPPPPGEPRVYTCYSCSFYNFWALSTTFMTLHPNAHWSETMCRTNDVDSSSRTLIEVIVFTLSIHFQFPLITFQLLLCPFKCCHHLGLYLYGRW